MNIKTVNQDIASLEKALKLIEKTENYLHFNKSHLIFEICEQINVLKEKRDRQETYIKTLSHEKN
jgi:hypothetical protein